MLLKGLRMIKAEEKLSQNCQKVDARPHIHLTNPDIW
jgi:hypothetical protein